MTIPTIRTVEWGTPGAPLLVLGPSLGTSAESLWGAAAPFLAHRFHLLAWDLPGHGISPMPAGPFSITDLASAVLSAVQNATGGTRVPPFTYAGVSVGGAVGLDLLLNHGELISSAILLATAARFTGTNWHERATNVRASGCPSMVEHSSRIWFSEGFLGRRPAQGAALLHALQEADSEGYARVCEALADFNVRDRLPEIAVPVLTIAGSEDPATPPAVLKEIAEGVTHGRVVQLDSAAHLPPVEQPARVATEIIIHADGARRGRDVFDAGMRVRRSVLGDEHVDHATVASTPLTAEFQDLITRYAWGTIWTRPGLDRRTRSLITITALVAHGHHNELAMHLRAARRNGVTLSEIRETLLQAAIYCGVPAANAAFHVAAEAFGTE